MNANSPYELLRGDPLSHEYTYDISMFRDTFETRFTYLNGFLRNVSRFGSRPALYDPHFRPPLDLPRAERRSQPPGACAARGRGW